MREPIGTLAARYVALPVDDVDTDQIIPARFLTTTQRTGLGTHLFADWRRAPDGTPTASFPLNRDEARNARILVAGRNFGCGSSREHAVWALTGAGFRAVISSSFADIFRANALANGLLPVQVSAEIARALLDAGHGELRVDLSEQLLFRGDTMLARFSIDPFARHCLMHGVDELQFLLDHSPRIAAYEQAQSPTGPAIA